MASDLPFFLRIAAALAVALLAGLLWTTAPLWGALCTALLPLVAYRLQRHHNRHLRKVLFLLDAIENNDCTIHFSETEGEADARLVNRALNRVNRILYNAKNDAVQREKYYELILECVNTGILVLNDRGNVYQKNSEALRLLGLNIFTHLRQLERVDPRLPDLLAHCRRGDKLQIALGNERGTVNLSIHVSSITVRGEQLRILALNDINNELDEKEIDSWMRLTRVLTHEIMNAVTPITSLSDTLLGLTATELPADEVRSGLQTISSTGKGLLAFVESYRRFTHIPTPQPSLFYVKEFLERMVALARHQHPGVPATFHIDVAPADLILHADENLVSQVVTNLLKNALQALAGTPLPAGQEGRIALRAYCNEAEAVVIEISNNGPAISRDLARHIFVPFFTTKEGGSGIGLSISRQIMRLSGGTLSLLPGRETTFVMQFN